MPAPSVRPVTGLLVYAVWLATSVIDGVGIDWALPKLPCARLAGAAPAAAHG